MAASMCEVISFMWLYIIYPSLLIRVYIKKQRKEKNEKKKKRQKKKKNFLYVPLYHSS